MGGRRKPFTKKNGGCGSFCWVLGRLVEISGFLGITFGFWGDLLKFWVLCLGRMAFDTSISSLKLKRWVVLLEFTKTTTKNKNSSSNIRGASWKSPFFVAVSQPCTATHCQTAKSHHVSAAITKWKASFRASFYGDHWHRFCSDFEIKDAK